MTIEEKKKAWEELEEKKIYPEKYSKSLDEDKKTEKQQTQTKSLEKLEDNKCKSKGLSTAIDNNVLIGYTKPKEEKGKGFKIKQLNRLFTILAFNKLNLLNAYIEWELAAGILNLKMENCNDRLFKSRVRKALRELKPTIEFKEDPNKGIKFTHIPKGSNEGYDIRKGETLGFTQLYCDLAQLDNRDFMVVFTILEYFKGSNKEVYPSLNTIAKLSGCSRRKTVELLKEGHELGLWDIESVKGGSKTNTNRYHLSYITEEGQERYHYLDAIEEEPTMNQDIEQQQEVTI